jgi:hypothetical protein
MKLLNLYESLDDNQNLQIQNKTRNFSFSTRTGLKCHGEFQWPSKHTSDDLIILKSVVELTDGIIPNDIYGQVILGAFDFIKTLGLDFSDISDLEIRMGSLFVRYMGLEVRMSDILLQTEKIHYNERLKLESLMNSEIENVYGTEILRNFPRFSDDLESRVQNLKSRVKNLYKTIRKGSVNEFIYELPENPEIIIKLSMDDVRKESTVISPNLTSHVYVDKDGIDIKNKPEDINDDTLNTNFFQELGSKFRKFKIKLIIFE